MIDANINCFCRIIYTYNRCLATVRGSFFFFFYLIIRPIRWPARSPDLNPLDFFLWGYCKEVVYKNLPENLDDLDAKLHEAIWTIEDNMLENVQINMLRRLRACVAMDGGHFEHFL